MAQNPGAGPVDSVSVPPLSTSNSFVSGSPSTLMNATMAPQHPGVPHTTMWSPHPHSSGRGGAGGTGGGSSHFSHGIASSATSALPSDNVIVANLPRGTDDAGLRALFAHIGPIVSAKVMVDIQSGHLKGYGFVRFTTVEHATIAVRTMDRRPVVTAGPAPNELHVAFSTFTSSSRRVEEESNFLYVANLPADITEAAVLELFSRHVRVVEVSVPRAGARKCIGVALVKCGSVDDARAAIAALNGSSPFGEAQAIQVRYKDVRHASHSPTNVSAQRGDSRSNLRHVHATNPAPSAPQGGGPHMTSAVLLQPPPSAGQSYGVHPSHHSAQMAQGPFMIASPAGPGVPFFVPSSGSPPLMPTPPTNFYYHHAPPPQAHHSGHHQPIAMPPAPTFPGAPMDGMPQPHLLPVLSSHSQPSPSSSPAAGGSSAVYSPAPLPIRGDIVIFNTATADELAQVLARVGAPLNPPPSIASLLSTQGTASTTAVRLCDPSRHAAVVNAINDARPISALTGLQITAVVAH